jgi:hypothetical protein
MRTALIVLTLLASASLARPAAAQTLQAPWMDLGYALAGTLGEPVLKASGSLASESALFLSLTNALPAQHCYLVIGAGTSYLPYKGGTLVPFPSLLVEYSTGSAGAVSIAAHFPPGVPAGVFLVLQFWCNDPGAPAGRSGSNAVGAYTP